MYTISFRLLLRRAHKIVSSNRQQAPKGFDVYNGGGSPGKPPPPPVPPTKEDASKSAKSLLGKRKPQGFASTILTGPGSTLGNPAGSPGITSILGS